ncbi:MAG: PAS domain S-box protein, partial [Bacteroidetes bacterium]|nr:PAS domain S-box protein [Bacteroidota bacterium]
MGQKSAFKVVVYYFIASILYIYFSDNLLTFAVPNYDTYVFFSSIKGFAFIVISSLFIFFLMKKYFRLEIANKEKDDRMLLEQVQSELDDNKRIKDELLKYQVNLNALIESSQQSIVLLDTESNILLFNKSADFYIHKLTGINLKKGLNLKSIVPDDILDSFEKNFNSALNNVPASLERKFNFDGKEIWVNFLYNPVYNQKNEIFGVIFTGIEITDRMNILMELKKTVEVYEELIKATPDAISITNSRGMIEYISPVALELLRISDISSALEQPCMKWFMEEDAEKVKNSIGRIIHDRKLTKGNVYRMKREDGTTFFAEFNSSPIINGEGNVNSFISTFRDITSRMESEEKLKVYSNELKELNASKDRFFSIVAHDLRNPLQGLLGFSSLLNDNFSDLTIDEVKEYIGYIFQSAKKMHSLTNNLLQWSRIKTGKIDYNP